MNKDKRAAWGDLTYFMLFDLLPKQIRATLAGVLATNLLFWLVLQDVQKALGLALSAWILTILSEQLWLFFSAEEEE